MLQRDTIALLYDDDAYHIVVEHETPQRLRIIEIVKNENNENNVASMENFWDLHTELRRAIIARVQRKLPGRSVTTPTR